MSHINVVRSMNVLRMEFYVQSYQLDVGSVFTLDHVQKTTLLFRLCSLEVIRDFVAWMVQRGELHPVAGLDEFYALTDVGVEHAQTLRSEWLERCTQSPEAFLRSFDEDNPGQLTKSLLSAVKRRGWVSEAELKSLLCKFYSWEDVPDTKLDRCIRRLVASQCLVSQKDGRTLLYAVRGEFRSLTPLTVEPPAVEPLVLEEIATVTIIPSSPPQEPRRKRVDQQQLFALARRLRRATSHIEAQLQKVLVSFVST